MIKNDILIYYFLNFFTYTTYERTVYDKLKKDTFGFIRRQAENHRKIVFELAKMYFPKCDCNF